MDFLPTQDQLDLIGAVRDLLTDRFDRAALAAVTGGYDEAIWLDLVELGAFSLRLPEDRGGLGLGWTETALVAEELGRACVPGPVVPSLIATEQGAEPGSVVTLLDLRQSPTLITHLDVASQVLVIKEDAAGLAEVEQFREAFEQVLEPVDPHTPIYRGRGADHHVAFATGRNDVIELQGAVIAAAFQVGIASKVTDLAVQYAKEREQFGSPIGGFQAVKHLCSDMLARAEVARAAVEAAALALDGKAVVNPGRATYSAKILADEAAVLNSRAAIQVYGGMGFTWEVELHYYLKRAWVLSTEWGSIEDHSDWLASIL